MADKDKPHEPDLSSLASDYMDLWQKQLSGMASDEAVASVMAQTAQLMNNGAAAVAAMALRQNSTDNGQDGTSGNPGAATAGTSSGVDDHVIVGLTERLERLEKRIAALETGADKTSK